MPAQGCVRGGDALRHIRLHIDEAVADVQPEALDGIGDGEGHPVDGR